MRDTRAMVRLGVSCLGLLVLAVMVLTFLGSRQRGSGIPVAVVAGVCFPLTWTIWYVRDEDPYRRRRRLPTS